MNQLMVAPQGQLVFSNVKGGTPSSLLEEVKVITSDLVLCSLVINRNMRRSFGNFWGGGGGGNLCPIDHAEWHFSGGTTE
jgi:hypothetical protein